MSQRKESYRAALQRNPATPPTPSAIVIRTRPVCVTIDVDPGLRRIVNRLTRYPADVLRTLERGLSHVRRPGRPQN